LAIATLGLFVWLAEQGVRRGWRHPIALAVATAALTLTAVADLIALLQPGEAGSATTLAQFVRGSLATLVGAFFFIGVAAISFRWLRSASRKWRLTGSMLTGALAFPVGLMATLYAACMLGLGCI
jgi:hypothetical protein